MHKLYNASIVISLVLLSQATVVSAEPVASRLPAAIPGPGGFSERAFPGDLPPAYPEWPERPVRNEIVPPPPGGPYMSSALNDFMVFPENTGGLRDEIKREPMEESPFFSADMPWPDSPDYDRPEPWIPDSGEYRYVPEEVVRQLESPQQPAAMPQQPAYRPHPRFPPPPPMRQPYYGYY